MQWKKNSWDTVVCVRRVSNGYLIVVTLDFGVLSFFILTSVDQNTVVPLYFFFILFFFFGAFPEAAS